MYTHIDRIRETLVMNCILTVKLTEETYIIQCKEITLFAHDSWHHDSIFSCPFGKNPLCLILFTVYLWTTWKLQERCELQLVAWYSFTVSHPNSFDYSSIRLNLLLLMKYQRQDICNSHSPPPHPHPIHKRRHFLSRWHKMIIILFSSCR